VGLDNSPADAGRRCGRSELTAGGRLHLAVAGMEAIRSPTRAATSSSPRHLEPGALGGRVPPRRWRKRRGWPLPAPRSSSSPSRHTFPEDVAPVAGEPFVFTEFSGRPQCFLTAEQLLAELGDAGFAPEPAVPLTEYNRPAPGSRPVAAAPATPSRPVIYEAAFRRRG
jgi:hypothetical protein